MDGTIKGTTATRRGRGTVSPELDRITDLARANKDLQFFSIAHLLTEEALMKAFKRLRKDASAGVDGVTYGEYKHEAPKRIAELHERLKGGRYRAQPLRRVYIPKENGKERPISIPSLEDKIVQRATVTLLNAIYEQDFLKCSYGFREEHSPHDALDAVRERICNRPIHYVLEADIVGYFDAIVRSQLMEMVEKRIRDGSVLRLLRKWIHIGVIDNGELLTSETGTGQGQVTSPLLANIYLHYVLDTWFAEEIRPTLRGEAYEVRFADDFILCFQYREDAEKVQTLLEERFATYGLTLHPDKTRLIRFSHRVTAEEARSGKTKPGTFDFLGFTHVAARSRWGNFTVHVRTMKKRLSRSLKEITAWCKANRHEPVPKQCNVLNQKLRGHYAYYGRSTNYKGIYGYFRVVQKTWKRQLERRTSGKRMSWKTFNKILTRHPLLKPKIKKPWSG